MVHAAALTMLVVLGTAGAQPTTPKTVWLVEPLYPGQEFVVSRSEEALNRLMPAESRPGDLIGTKELAKHLEGRAADLRCLTGDVACSDPIDFFVRELGLERVVLIKGGQEEGSYRFKVTSYIPGTGESIGAEGANPVLDKALMAALVKVVPLASVVEVSSTPDGATVFIDNEKVGTTPYTGQILPGERTVKLEAPSHMPAEKKLNVPVRGKVQVSEKLEKVPARIVITAAPEGTAIVVDGQQLGVDKVDKPIQPGAHTIELNREGYLPHTEQADIKPGDTFTFDKKLEPTTWTSMRLAMKEAEEDIYARKVFLDAGFQMDLLHTFSSTDPKMLGHGFANAEFRVQAIPTGEKRLLGGFIGYGHEGKYFGLLAVGGGYFRSQEPWSFRVQDDRDSSREIVENGFVDGVMIRAFQPHLRLAIWRTVLYLRAGPELRGTRFGVSGELANQTPEGLFTVQVNLMAQALLRIYVVDGLFLEGGYHYSLALFGNANPNGFSGGLGYAF